MNKEALTRQFWNLSPQEYADFLSCAEEKRSSFAKYFIHTHTDYGSPKDSVLTAKDYVQTAKDMGAKAIAVTDHGTMYAVQLLNKLCGEAGIKLLVGCEFYVCEDVENTNLKKHTRLHLCGYAKDTIGYHTLARMITESNTRILTVHSPDGDLNYPCISKKILAQFMGPGTAGHGHVILTSACIGGVLTGISYANDTVRANALVLEEKISQCRDVIAFQSRLQTTKDSLEEKKAAFETAAKNAENKEEKERFSQNAKEMKKMIEDANKEMKKLQKEIDKLTGKASYDKAHFPVYVNALEQEHHQLLQELIPESEIAGHFEQEAIWYDQLAGHGNWFIELQYHGIPAEKKYMPYLADMAERLQIPTVAANDAHMRCREDTDLRKLINGLRFNRYEAPQTGDEELYLKSDVELFRSLRKAVLPKQAFRAMQGRELLADACTFKLEKEPNYPKYRD